MTPIQSVLITGANAGLGREAARQLAEQKGIDKIILACRSADKAQAAKAALEAETGRKIFDVLLIDMMNPATIRNAVSEMTSPVDAVILNAGGTGGRTPYALTTEGVTHVFATNVLGHVVLVNEMLERQLITSSVLYAGSEAARGIPKMGIPRPELDSDMPKEFTSIADGSKFGPEGDPLVVYANI
jgi:NAD(P)-dependent dehydrogenase (short-subunit alcohol dehydrogenase family)